MPPFESSAEQSGAIDTVVCAGHIIEGKTGEFIAILEVTHHVSHTGEKSDVKHHDQGADTDPDSHRLRTESRSSDWQ
jgi:hypothetical protein